MGDGSEKGTRAHALRGRCRVDHREVSVQPKRLARRHRRPLQPGWPTLGHHAPPGAADGVAMAVALRPAGLARGTLALARIALVAPLPERPRLVRHGTSLGVKRKAIREEVSGGA